MDAITQFSDAIRASGLPPPDSIIGDGQLHRFSSNGKRGDEAGWYVFYDGDIPAGSFGDWRSGLTQSWSANDGRKLNAAETKAHRARMDAMRKQREAEEVRGHEEAAAKARAILKASQPAPEDHPYLVRKGIKPNGAKVHEGRLVLPMRDARGKLCNVESIAPVKPPEGSDKKGLYRGKRIGCYFSIGNPTGAAVLCIAEGFATGSSLHEATGHPVAVAFNAGNLLPVAQALHDKFPDLPIILCADDDIHTEGNPGLTKASEAARAVDGYLAIPDFGPDRPAAATDFNDMHLHCGLEAVRGLINCIADLASSPPDDDPSPVMPNLGVSEETGVQPNSDAPLTDTPANQVGVSRVSERVAKATDIPTLEERPQFRVLEDWLDAGGFRYRPGVWHFGVKPGKGGEPPIPTQSWVCSPLYVEAVTFDIQDNNFGRLLRFRNTLNHWREWAMPMEMLRGAGDDLRGELLAMGVEIDPMGKFILANYLQAKPPKRRMRCALQVGWCGDSFVLPDIVIGPKASGVIFQSGERSHDEHTLAGTLSGWQSEIAARAVGNPLFALALSASFAGPMLARCSMEGGGLNLFGDSSTGKTTLIEAACATWGGPNFRRSWRATANGMEGAAALFNDCLLALDEISECDPREVGAIIYALGNGRGKQRASRAGSARGITRWRCFVLSSGERTIATTMAEGGHRAKAGQAVRLLDIPVLRTYGAWDCLHDLPSGTAFSDSIKRASMTHYGHAGRAFLDKLTRDPRDFCALLEQIKALPVFAVADGEGQDKRAASRLALLALAGELATEYGITGWPEGEAIKAATEGFSAWRGARGRGNDERRQILERVSGFIERHGDGRFSDADLIGDVPLRDRAGWWRVNSEGREYLFTTDGMREALKGFDFNRALDALQESGALPPPGADGKRARFMRIGGRGMRIYAIHPDKLGGDHGA